MTTRFAWAAAAGILLSPVFAVHAADVRTPCAPPANTIPIDFQSGGNELRGFIDFPEGSDRHPAILIVHGGGDTDVTVDTYYDEMRRAFRAAGIATVIWDKAGNGCSSGKYSTGWPIQERASETLAAVAMLAKRHDIDPHRIGLWALSQGGLVAPMAATRSNDIAFLIVASGLGRDALSQGLYPSIRLLRDSGVDAAEATSAYLHLRRSLAILRAGGRAEDAVAECEVLARYPALRPMYRCDLAGRATDAGALEGSGMVSRGWRIPAAGGTTDVGDVRQTRRGSRLAREHRCVSKRIPTIRKP